MNSQDIALWWDLLDNAFLRVEGSLLPGRALWLPLATEFLVVWLDWDCSSRNDFDWLMRWLWSCCKPCTSPLNMLLWFLVLHSLDDLTFCPSFFDQVFVCRLKQPLRSPVVHVPWHLVYCSMCCPWPSTKKDKISIITWQGSSNTVYNSSISSTSNSTAHPVVAWSIRHSCFNCQWRTGQAVDLAQFLSLLSLLTWDLSLSFVNQWRVGFIWVTMSLSAPCGTKPLLFAFAISIFLATMSKTMLHIQRSRPCGLLVFWRSAPRPPLPPLVRIVRSCFDHGGDKGGECKSNEYCDRDSTRFHRFRKKSREIYGAVRDCWRN